MTHQAKFSIIVKGQTKTAKSLVDKNFNLSEQHFSQMVKDLKQGKEQLFEQMFMQHFSACRNYLIRQRGADAQTAYDASMEALLDMRQRLIDGSVTYGNLKFLLTRMAVQIYIRWQKKETHSLEKWSEGSSEEWPSFLEDQESLQALQKAWAQMCTDCQKVLHSFYHLNQTLKEMAIDVGLSHAALRKRKERCVAKLKDHFKTYYQ